MDIKQPRSKEYRLKGIEEALRYGNKDVELVGSASYESISYIGDYDYSVYVERESKRVVFNNILGIVRRMRSLVEPKAIFVEMKIENADNKQKVKRLSQIKYDNFDYNDSTKYIKLDYVVIFDNSEVREISSIYFFDNIGNFDKSLKEDIRELYKEGEYYKVLKRLFSLLRYRNENMELIKKLVRFFNSGVGRIYSRVAELKAIKILKDNNRIQEYLKNLDLNTIKREILIGKREYNDKAYKFIIDENLSDKK